jgi:hypothetical protein
MFDLEEFFTRLCTRRRSHLSSNGTSWNTN